MRDAVAFFLLLSFSLRDLSQVKTHSKPTIPRQTAHVKRYSQYKPVISCGASGGGGQPVGVTDSPVIGVAAVTCAAPRTHGGGVN